MLRLNRSHARQLRFPRRAPSRPCKARAFPDSSLAPSPMMLLRSLQRGWVTTLLASGAEPAWPRPCPSRLIGVVQLEIAAAGEERRGPGSTRRQASMQRTWRAPTIVTR